MDRKKIYPAKNNAWNEEDRMKMALILLKGGYSVRVSSESKEPKTYTLSSIGRNKQ